MIESPPTPARPLEPSELLSLLLEVGERLASTLDLDELLSRVAELIKPHKAGRLVNQIRKLAEDVVTLPLVQRSPDPEDDFLLALAEAGQADYLVTGDKSGLLTLGTHKVTRIVSAREFAALLDLGTNRDRRLL